MRNWRELGEVPDSDDEGEFDSQDSLLAQLPLPPTTSHPTEGQEDAKEIWDIPDDWDIPDSPEQADRNPVPTSDNQTSVSHTPTRTAGASSSAFGASSPSSPLSSPPLSLNFERDSLKNWGESSGQVERGNDEGGQSKSAAKHSQLSESFRAHDIAIVSDPLSGPWSDFRPVGDESTLQIANPGRRPTATVSERAISPPRYTERSLRPRKPIQQHPYLLENALYSSTLKSHGLKPIRPLHGTVGPKPVQGADKDSQDAEFEGDTQETENLDPEETEETEESQFLPGVEDPFDDNPIADGIAPIPITPQGSTSRQSKDSSSAAAPTAEPTVGIDDDEEFPDLEDLLKRRVGHPPEQRPRKRRAYSPRITLKEKGPQETPGLSPAQSPPAKFKVPPPIESPSQYRRRPLSPLSNGQSAKVLKKSALDRPFSGRETPAAVTKSVNNATTSPIEDVFPSDIPPAEPAVTVTESSSSETESESESEVVRKVGRRIKGVLPASWLRLDQEKSRDRVQKRVRQKSPPQSPDKVQRRGIAQPRQRSHHPEADVQFLIESESEDEVTPPILWPRDPIQTTLPPAFRILEDDDDSVVEDNSIDHLAPSLKRKPLFSDSNRPKKVRRNNSTVKGGSSLRTRQPKITTHLSRSGTSASSKAPPSKKSKRSSGHRKSRTRKVATPPRLSIVDVIESKAPDFLRVAARSVMRQKSLGRVSPSRKSITLGSRQDNIDALSVLRDWKEGKIKQKASVVPRQTRLALDVESPTLNHEAPVESFVPRLQPAGTRYIKVSRGSHHYATDPLMPQPAPIATSGQKPHAVVKPSTSRKIQTNSAFRPAQLETTAGAKLFSSRKRALDLVFRKSRKEQPIASNPRIARFLADNGPPSEAEILPSSNASSKQPETSRPSEPQTSARKKSRYKKRFVPRNVDLSAPRYSHADDPLPLPTPAMPEVPLAEEQIPAHKLGGLGPFGTTYTLHFEVFPLEPGVFFHESTFVGGGKLEYLRDDAFLSDIREARPAVVVSLEQERPAWGMWDDKISSDLGIIVDLVFDWLQSQSTAELAVEAADSVLNYINKALFLADVENEASFISRISELLDRLVDRLGSGYPRTIRARLSVLMRFQAVALQCRRICLHSPASRPMLLVMEEKLKRLCQVAMELLIDVGTTDIEDLYDRLLVPGVKERGIRANNFTAVAWASLIQTLSAANIPRASFSDILYAAIADKLLTGTPSAHSFERAWRLLFCLLPLTQFDLTGVLGPYNARGEPLNGWTLPTQLVRRIFDLYKLNPRQAPSFNEYCRAIVGRCQVLVDQWRWTKCTGIISVIFDFFSSQGLAHLRNEEVFKSPRFLDDLAGQPLLRVQPEDRCFHVFLKLVAIAIRHFHEQGEVNAIRNLVTRILPNQNLHHQKEQSLHQRELAALRNHHDLLCTLFWAAPADCRPTLTVIEKLVSPGSSHKEACLVNLRAWSQLAKFVVASGDAPTTYPLFIEWHSRVFRDVLAQYNEAGADIQRQRLELPSNISQGVGEDMVAAMAKMNQAAVLDILHFCVKSSLEVLRLQSPIQCLPHLLNTDQLAIILTRFDFSLPDANWSFLDVVLDTVDVYLQRIRSVDGPPSGNGVMASEADEALFFFDKTLSTSFLQLARTVLSLSPDDSRILNRNWRLKCIEKVAIVSGRFVAMKIRAGRAKLQQFFAFGENSIYDKVEELTWGQRRSLPLFFAHYLDGDNLDFEAFNLDPITILMTSIINPLELGSHEHVLALALQSLNHPYLRQAQIPGDSRPSYVDKRELFRSIVISARHEIASAEPANRKQLSALLDRVLGAVMLQLKKDLQTKYPITQNRDSCVVFARDIIEIIKSHGVEARIDQFFLEPSSYFSPAPEDPRLQTATIISYSHKISEGHRPAVSTLFYYLVNNLKVAVVNADLPGECRILERAMGEPGVLSFMLSHMIPIVIHAAIECSDCWPVVDVYFTALRNTLEKRTLPLSGADKANAKYMFLFLLRVCMLGIMDQFDLEPVWSDKKQIHVYTQLISLGNILEPFCVMQDGGDRTEVPPWQLTGFRDFYMHLWAGFTRKTGDVFIERRPSEMTSMSASESEMITPLSQALIQEVKRNWEVDDAGSVRAVHERNPTFAFSGPRRVSMTENCTGFGAPSFLKEELSRLTTTLYIQSSAAGALLGRRSKEPKGSRRRVREDLIF